MMIPVIECLIFDDYEKAVEANIKIYQNMLAAWAAERGSVYNASTKLDESIGDIDAKLPMTYPILGKQEGIEQKQKGYAIQWGSVVEKYNVAGEYFLSKPIDSLMDGVVGYTAIEERDITWYPPMEEI